MFLRHPAHHYRHASEKRRVMSSVHNVHDNLRKFVRTNLVRVVTDERDRRNRYDLPDGGRRFQDHFMRDLTATRPHPGSNSGDHVVGYPSRHRRAST